MDSDKSYYVYQLIDPRTKNTFYVGKGNGDRVYAHIKNALKNYNGVDYTGRDSNGKIEDDVSTKIAVIREIHDQGLEVEAIIKRDGLDEQTAYEVEAALIDTIPGLANLVRGHGTDRGPKIVNLGQSSYDGSRRRAKAQPEHKIKKPDVDSKRGQIIADIRRRGYLSVDDKISFHRIDGVLNDLFDIVVGAWMKASYPMGNDGRFLWFPKTNAPYKKYKPNPKTYGQVTAACWSNVLSFDGMTITQEWIATDYLPPWPPEDKNKNQKIVPIATFAKEKNDDYRFVGVFTYDQENSHDYTTVRKRISKELSFIEWRQ